MRINRLSADGRSSQSGFQVVYSHFVQFSQVAFELRQACLVFIEQTAAA